MKRKQGENMNRTFYLLPLACLLGFAVGHWGPSADMRAMKEHAGKEKKVAEERQRGGFDAFAHLAKIPETASRSRRGRPRRAAAKRPAIAVTNAPKETASASDPSASASENRPQRDEWRKMSPDDLRARIAEAQDLWATRVDIARAQWKSRLQITGESEKAFDDALQEMNENIYTSVSALVARLADKENMSMELGLRLVGDTTAILAETYDKIGACVAPEMRDEVSDIQMIDFIDPAVAEPLIDVQDKLENFRPRSRRKESAR